MFKSIRRFASTLVFGRKNAEIQALEHELAQAAIKITRVEKQRDFQVHKLEDQIRIRHALMAHLHNPENRLWLVQGSDHPATGKVGYWHHVGAKTAEEAILTLAGEQGDNFRQMSAEDVTDNFLPLKTDEELVHGLLHHHFHEKDS